MGTITIDEFIFRIYENPILRTVSKRDIVTHIRSVIRLVGVPAMLEEKRVVLNVQNYRVIAPPDIHTIKSVMAPSVNGTNTRLLSSQGDRIQFQGEYRDQWNSLIQYKFVEKYIYTDFESGEIEVIYTGYKVDKKGWPLIPDNESLLLAIENFIKVRHFTIAVENGQMPMAVLERAEQQYTWYIGQASNAFTIPSPEEAISLSNALTALVIRTGDFESNFKYSGAQEFFKNH